MNKSKKRKYYDGLFYILLLALIVIAGAAYFSFRYNPNLQFMVIASLVGGYVVWGLLFHYFRHDTTLKIYLEYLLIASIVLLCGILVFWR